MYLLNLLLTVFLFDHFDAGTGYWIALVLLFLLNTLISGVVRVANDDTGGK